MAADAEGAETVHPLRALRWSLNLTVEALAERAGLDARTVRRAEQGARLNPGSIDLLCKALQRSPEALGLARRRGRPSSTTRGLSPSSSDHLGRRSSWRSWVPAPP